MLCIGVLAGAIAAQALVGTDAQAQTITLSTNATIGVPVGPTMVSVPVNVLGNVVNLNVNVTGTAGGVTLLPTTVTMPVTINGNAASLTLNVAPGTIPILGGQSTISLPITITLPPDLLPAVVTAPPRPSRTGATTPS